MMKDENTSDDVPTSGMSAHQHENGSDSLPLPSPTTVPQEAPAQAHPPRMERWLTPRHRMGLLLVAMVVLLLVALAGGYSLFRVVAQPSRHASSAFQEVHCPFPLGAGLVEGQDVRCGFLRVPEDRSLSQGLAIRLAVAIFKTPSSQPDPDPVLLLSGGPGDPLLERIGPMFKAGNLAYRTQNRDVILLDQRGVGYSQPSLRCLVNETLRTCHDRLVKSGINLNAFTTLENAADVHDLVQALGYQQVNLDGASYGTELALTVMRLFPVDVRSVVLDSVLPPQANSFRSFPRAAVRAFDVLFHGCAADPHCNEAYPHLQAVFYQLVGGLNTTPITFQTTLQTGKSVTVKFTG